MQLQKQIKFLSKSKEKEPFKLLKSILQSEKEYLRKNTNNDSILKLPIRKACFMESFEERVNTLLKAIEDKDPYTRGHSEAVAYYSVFLAKQIGFNQDELDNLQIAAHLHDIGKIMIDRKILMKPSLLNNTERLIVKKHPEMGVRILKTLSTPEEINLAIKHHHERYDGCGYPDRLYKKQIPLESRILSIADAFDAMTTTRPYRNRRDISEALKEVSRGSGTQFDPELTEIFNEGISRVYSKIA